MSGRRLDKKVSMGYVFGTALMVVLAIITTYPFVWMIFSSFKLDTEIVTYPPSLFGENYTVTNYQKIWDRLPFLRYYLNTVIFAGGTTLISLLFDSMAGYAFARLQFRGRNGLFMLVMCTLMVPFQVIMIGLFFVVNKLGILNTFWGLILPRASSAFGIFMMRQFFLTLPKDLEDAARIDGCSEFKIFLKVMLPQCKPALLSLGIFHLMNNWNYLLYPLILTTDNKMYTIAAGLATFKGQHVVEYGLTMAGACLSILPVLIVYFFAQKQFIEGMAMTGMKD